MKRNLRIVIDDSTVVGHLLEKSNWYPSRVFEQVAVASYLPSLRDQRAFGKRVSALLGFVWNPWQSSFSYCNTIDPTLKVEALAPTSVTEWLNANASDLWLPCITTYFDALGWRKRDVRFWFRDEADATLFAVACA